MSENDRVQPATPQETTAVAAGARSPTAEILLQYARQRLAALIRGGLSDYEARTLLIDTARSLEPQPTDDEVEQAYKAASAEAKQPVRLATPEETAAVTTTSRTVAQLIEAARKNPAKSVIGGLLNEGEIAGLHGTPEAFKTIFALQLAESLASGTPFLDLWPVPRARTVYFLESEMSVSALGTRLGEMFKGRTPPDGIRFADEQQLRAFRRAPNLEKKFELLSVWVSAVRADAVLIDTANPFFRGKQTPNDETTAGAFLDLLEALPAQTKIFVRHNRKQSVEDGTDAATKIRGSGQFADVADLLIEIRRTDKRTHEAVLSVTKFRHGSKPGDLTLWFDQGSFRLVPVPPVIALLLEGPRSRRALLQALQTRFGVGQRKGDEMVKGLRPYLRERQVGHQVVFEIDWAAFSPDEEPPLWFAFFLVPWSRYAKLRQGVTVEDTQSCISSTGVPEGVHE